MKYLLSLALACLTGLAQAGTIGISGPFRGLNDADSSITLADGEAQDLLNVEVSPDGYSVGKRSGYSLLDTMIVSTAPIYGSIIFRDVSGNNVEIYANDVAVYKSVNSGAYSQFITTATRGAKWSFCEAAGIVYAFNDQHDTPFSYDGTTVNYYNDASIVPKASLCAMTPTRMLIAGTTDYPNRLYFSAVGDYDNFTLGTDEEDPSFDDIGLAGDKITGLWANAGEWLIWKTYSLISYQGTNQYDLVASVISGRVGLSDPQAIVEHNGIVYFRGTNARIWAYSAGTLTDLTQKLENFVANSTKDITKSRQYLTKATWDLGTFDNMASTITNGAIEPWLVGFSDKEDADFEAGTGSSVTIVNNEISINNFQSGTFPNMGFEMGDFTNWTDSGLCSFSTNSTNCYGNYCVKFATNVGGSNTYLKVTVHDASDDSELYALTLSGGNNVYNINLSPYSDVLYLRYGYSADHPNYCIQSVPFLKSDGNITIRSNFVDIGSPYTRISDISQGIDVTSATFTSQTFDTGADVGQKYCYMTTTKTVPTDTFALQYIQSSTDDVHWSLRETTTDYLNYSTTDQYVRYQVDFFNETSYNKPTVDDIGINCVSTGSWVSDEFYTGNFTDWGQFRTDTTLTGSATYTYYISTSAIAGGTGATWYEIEASSAIGVSISPYVKVKAVNNFHSSTDTVRLNLISYGYNILTDHLAAAFEYLGDIFFSVPYNGSTSNNRVMKLDTTAGGWTIFDIPMNAPLVVGDYVHFGSPTDGKIYTYPSGNSDNGTAINSYWKSKDYGGDNIYVERTFDKMSIYLDANTASDIDATYSIEPSTSITFNIPLTQTDGSNYIRNNRQLPAGTWGTLFNLQLGNNAADKPWRFYGATVDYSNDPWRAYP